MKTLLKKVTVLQPGADPAEPRDILIEDGIITRIAKNITDGTARVVTSPNLHAAPGFVDIGAQPGQPGFEFRETFASLARGAQAGGYTALAVFPRTQPPVHSRIEVEYVHNACQDLPVRIHAIGAISQDLEGKDLTEMIDMARAGAVAFADGRKAPVEAGLLTRALDYVMPFNGLVIQFPLNRTLTVDGQMHEGPVSTSMGLTGIPDVAEEITVQRDIRLLAYTGSRLHFHGIASGDSLAHIQRARAQKLRLTADTGAIHLLLEDSDVGDFNADRKILPPLRSAASRKALIKAVRDGHIDHISALHTPLEIEAKACEFTYAGFGSVGLESAFATAMTALRDTVPLETIVDKFSAGPRRILGLQIPVIERGRPAEITLFDPDLTWTYAGAVHSLSRNDALAGQTFTGKVIGTVYGGQLWIN